MALDVTYIGCDRPEDRDFVDRHLLPIVRAALGQENRHVQLGVARLEHGLVYGAAFDEALRESIRKLRPDIDMLHMSSDEDGIADGYALIVIDDRTDAGWRYVSKKTVVSRPREAEQLVRDLYTAILDTRLQELVSGFGSDPAASGEE